MKEKGLSRRELLERSGAVGMMAATTAPWLPAAAPRQGKADSCIFIWLGGGASHIDTFDPKRRGDPRQRKAGSAYDPIDTAIEGVQVCEHLRRTAEILDRTVIIRSCHHDVIDEHAAAVNRVHTGRPPTGTTIYPSIGSVTAHQLGARAEGLPAYVVMGYPSASRGPGFLGARNSYLYLTETSLGPAALKRPHDVTLERQQRRNVLLDQLRSVYLRRNPRQEKVKNYAQASVEGMKLVGPEFTKVFELESEPQALRDQFGGEFGQRCLLARRLVQAGVRFVEVSFNLNFINGTGWDTHNEGQKNQHTLIRQLDQAFSTLLLDLEKHQRLDRTLVVVATEFGRPPEFDSRGGRGHYSKAFSMVLAGGGLRTGQVVGQTDAMGREIVQDPVSLADFHATIYAAMGIDASRVLYDGDRPVPITDSGKPIDRLFGS
ncbi:MAG: hypothetical protein CMJ59_19265 [Planctomycetaceae bacterium]|nr:hypothetical protein [Planctomycetaceae bacterium]